MDVRQSVCYYLKDVFRWWWIVMIGVVFSITGLGLDVWQGWTLPLWLWGLFGVLGLIVAQFLAYHYKRVRPTLLIECGNSDEFNKAYPLGKVPTVIGKAVSETLGEGRIYIAYAKLLKVTNTSGAEADGCKIRITQISPADVTTATPIQLEWFGQGTKEIPIEPFGHAYAVLTKTIQAIGVPPGFVADGITPIPEGQSALVTVVAWVKDSADKRTYRIEQTKGNHPDVFELDTNS